MNNKELITLFREINKLDNCFDREIALKKANKQYKKSVFYKSTHYSIRQAYQIFNFNSLNSLFSLLNSKTFTDLARGDIASLQASIETFIETFDMSVFDHIFAAINEKLSAMQGDTNILQSDLKNIMQEFQNSLK
jgi:hypothetical protein